MTRRHLTLRLGGAALLSAIALVWTAPFLWMLVAAFRPESAGSRDMASLLPSAAPTLANFRLALDSADFAVYALNTLIVVAGIDRQEEAGGRRQGRAAQGRRDHASLRPVDRPRHDRRLKEIAVTQ